MWKYNLLRVMGKKKKPQKCTEIVKKQHTDITYIHFCLSSLKFNLIDHVTIIFKQQAANSLKSYLQLPQYVEVLFVFFFFFLFLSIQRDRSTLLA